MEKKTFSDTARENTSSDQPSKKVAKQEDHDAPYCNKCIFYFNLLKTPLMIFKP